MNWHLSVWLKVRHCCNNQGLKKFNARGGDFYEAALILVEQQALEGIPLGPLERPRILGRCQLFKFAFGINPFQVSPDIVRGGFEKLRHLPLAEPHGGLVAYSDPK